jgi:hypothetical protein
MYEMVTGIPPYSGDNFMEILTKKATQDPLPPQVVRSELPAQVSDLVTAAMARNPNDRPQTMEALEYELNKCLAGRGVAVAQILGMTTDAHVVATLNPGLSMRQFDDAAVVARAQTSSPAIGMPRAGTHSGMIELPSMFSGPAVSTGQNTLIVRPSTEPSAAGYSGPAGPGAQLRAPTAPSASTSDPSLQVSQPVAALRRSALGVFGWIVLAAVLFGGVGSLLYIALGERSAASKASDATAAAAAGSSREAPVIVLPNPEDAGTPPAVAEVVPSPRTIVPVPDAVTAGGVVAGDDGRADASKPDGNRRGDRRRPPPRVATIPRRGSPPPPSGDDKSIAALVNRAKAFEKDGRWTDARAVYHQLEKVKGYSLGEALYHQAYAAIQSNATEDAVKLAAQAGHLPGPFKTPAMFLYGDAWYRQGEFVRAKGIYITLRKTVAGDDRATATKKIAACNKELQLPESDGVAD